MAKLIINLIAHDGITSLYTGVGRIDQDSLNILCQKSIHLTDYTVNAITGKYNQKCLGFSERIKSVTQRKLEAIGGRLYECSNGSAGDISYGDISNWDDASLSAAIIVKNIAEENREALCINLCLDTPFANVSSYYSQYKKDDNIFIWIPHSTVLIHKIDSAITFSPDYFKKRFDWEKKSIDFANAQERVYLGCIGKFMKRHLINDYGANSEKLIDFTDGLDTLSPRYRRRVSQKEIKRFLRKISISTNKKIFFSFGRLESCKGLDHTIRIGGLLAKKGYQTVLMAQPYTKKDPLIAEYKRCFRRYNPTGVFIYNYPFDLPHKIMRWKNTRVLFIPSVAEPFGLIPEEARLYQNHNMTVIAANTGGLTEQINDGVDGFLVDIENLEKSYKKVLKIILMNSKEIREISANGYKKVKLNYDLRKNLARSVKEILKHDRKNRHYN